MKTNFDFEIESTEYSYEMSTIVIPKKYKDWIDKNVEVPQNNCQSYSSDMAEAFPELIRVRGYYDELIRGKTPHWWLKTKDGLIVDPTQSQFCGPNIPFFYEEIDESIPQPTGMCPNCGEYCYNESYVCSPRCEKEYIDYINSVGI